jgi:hypothetical protein
MFVFVEITPRWPASSGAIRVTSAADRRAQTWDGQRWAAAIADSGSLVIDLFAGDFGKEVEIGIPSLTLASKPLLEAYPAAKAVRWEGAEVRMWAGQFTTAAGSASFPYPNNITPLAVGTVTRAEVSDNIIKIRIDAQGKVAQTNVLTLEYAGTGGAEGGFDRKGTLKPWVFGHATNVEPVPIDTDNSIYQFSGYGPIQRVAVLYERGSDFGPSFGDLANYAALVAADVPPGRWATCLAEGLIKLGAPQAGVITGDVEGHISGGTCIRKTGQIIAAISAARGVAVDAASLAALDIFTDTLPSGGFVELFLKEQTDILSLARRLCAPLNAQAGVSPLGNLFAVRVNAILPSFTVDAQGRRLPLVSGFSESDTPPPFKKIVMGGAPVWRVHDIGSEIAFYAQPVPRGRFSATETYREGDVVDLADGSTWLYINPVASSGNAPVVGGAYWYSLSGGPELEALGGILTRRAPDLIPDQPPIGSLYIDEANDSFRFDGLELAFEGEPLLFNGLPLLGPGYTYVVPLSISQGSYAVEIVPPSAQTIYSNFAGTAIDNQFPRTLTPVVKRGNTDIRTANEALYSITATAGIVASVNNVIGDPDKGRITVTEGTVGNIMLTVTLGGRVFGPYKINFSVQQAQPPAIGGTGAKSASDSLPFPSVTTTSFDVVAGPMTVTVATGQSVACAFPPTYSIVGLENVAAALIGKWQSSPAGAGTWTDAPASPITGDEATWFSGDFAGTPGGGVFNQTITGLGAGDYDIRFVGKLSSALGSPTLEIFAGTAHVLVQ